MFQDRVEDIIRRQRVMICLVVAQFGRRRAPDDVFGDDRFTRAPVDVFREFVNQRLRHVLESRASARHVAVKRLIADAGLALVAGRKDQRAEFVRERHQYVAADARLEVLFRDAHRRTGEGRFEHLQILFKSVFNRDDVVIDAEVFGQLSGVARAFGRRIAPRHKDAGDVSGAERVGGDAGGQSRIDSARRSNDYALEPVLADVIARAYGQGLINLFGRPGERMRPRMPALDPRPRIFKRLSSKLDPLDADACLRQIDSLLPPARIVQALFEDLLGVDVGDDQVLLEQFAAGDDAPALADDQALAVEDQFVLAAHQIHVCERDGVVFGARGQHPLAVAPFAGVVGRSRDVDDQLRPGERLDLRRTARIPDVFADVHADQRVAVREDRRRPPRVEITVLVEDAVIRKEVFVVDAFQPSVANHGRRIVNVDRPVHEADDRNYAGRRGDDSIQSLQVRGDELRFEQEIFRGIAGQREFGNRDYVRPDFTRALDVGDDLGRVAGEIADRGIDLRERYADGGHVNLSLQPCQ